MPYWCGVAFGFGLACFLIGRGAIPIEGEGPLALLKWSGLAIALAGCIGAYRIRARAREAEAATTAVGPRRCPECGTSAGSLHEPFCLVERCPFCGGQLAACECVYTVLKLDDEDRRIYEEYVDDSVEPLKSLVARWNAALAEKGRVPFQAADDSNGPAVRSRP